MASHSAAFGAMCLATYASMVSASIFWSSVIQVMAAVFLLFLWFLRVGSGAGGAGAGYAPRTGMLNDAPSRGPLGQVVVMVLVRV